MKKYIKNIIILLTITIVGSYLTWHTGEKKSNQQVQLGSINQSEY